jgi:hypothetical protein
MKTVRRAERDWIRPTGHHREGVIEFLHLFGGNQGSASGYTMNVARFEEYFTPRHRHNYDQIRFCFRAPFPYARDKVIPAGWIGYFPEGTFYGPQDVRCELESGPEVLTWQFGGSSGMGFVSGRGLGDAWELLAQQGRFEHGTYITTDANGSEHRQDGYEAAWSTAMGQALQYPPARFSEPVLMDPAAFEWVETDQPGVRRKLLACFEHGLSMSFVALDSGAYSEIGAHGAVQHAYVMEGTGIIGGTRVEPGTALEFDAGERGAIVAETSLEIFRVCLPALV